MSRHIAWFGIAGSAIVILSAVVSCASSQSIAIPTRSVVTTLYVTNNRWEDVTIYIGAGDPGLTLGTVPSMQRRKFPVPDAYLGSGSGLRLRADALASRERYTSEIFSVVPGSRMEWSIEHRMKYSSLVIR